MYAHILSSALDDWVDQLTDEALVEYALVCRTETLACHGGKVALTALSAQIAYDRALLKLGEAHGINVKALTFLHPSEDRAFLEASLAAAGLDLVAEAALRDES